VTRHSGRDIPVACEDSMVAFQMFYEGIADRVEGNA
jgi:hypothetical protein